MKIVIGCDGNGYELKEHIVNHWLHSGVDFTDLSPCLDPSVDYPDVALHAARLVQEGKFDRGVLICGTGIGMAIAANKVKGVYAAVGHDLYSTERSILSNNVQILCMGALVIGRATAVSLLTRWLALNYVDSPSGRKLRKIQDAEENNCRSSDPQ